MKKLIAVAGAGAMLLSIAGPAFAYGSYGSADVAIVNNGAIATSNTGNNSQGNVSSVYKGRAEDVSVSGNNNMTTGAASSYAGAVVVANTHVGCGCESSRHHSDVAIVDNGALAGSNSGANGQGNASAVEKGRAEDVRVSGTNSLVTGDSSSTARAWTIVNTHFSLGSSED